MKYYPLAKINLGLNIVSKRSDGYHNLETVFYPVKLCDELLVEKQESGEQSQFYCNLQLKGDSIKGNIQENLIVKAYSLLYNDFRIPKVNATLIKNIPSQAGMGGGSSDAACMLKMLNEMFSLNLNTKTLENYALKLGADCPFFIKEEPCFAQGIGEIFTPINNLKEKLSNLFIVIVKPQVSVSTAMAFKSIVPTKPNISCNDIVSYPIDAWKEFLINDFEKPIFEIHPDLEKIKMELYKRGAKYAAMSGSGSAIFGLFDSQLFKTCHDSLGEKSLDNCCNNTTYNFVDFDENKSLNKMFPNSQTYILPL